MKSEKFIDSLSEEEAIKAAYCMAKAALMTSNEIDQHDNIKGVMRVLERLGGKSECNVSPE